MFDLLRFYQMELFCLKEFKTSNSFYLELAIQTVETLGNILKECAQIKELCVPIIFRIDSISKERLNTLLKATHQVITLKIFVFRLDLVEYLAKKYQDIDYILIGTTKRDFPWDAYNHRISLDSHNIDHIANLFAHILNYELKFRLKRGFTLKTIQRCILVQNDKNCISRTKVQNITYYNPTIKGPEMKRIVERIHHLVVKNKN